MERNFNFDQMRVMSCIMVILIHICNIYNRSFPNITNNEYMFVTCVNAISRISVPIFFMISGALMASKKPDLKKSINRFLKYLIITVFWCVFYFLWDKLYMKDNYDIKEIFSTPPSKHLWFLYALLSIYLALPIIQIIIRNISDKFLYYVLLLFAISVFGGYVLDFFDIAVKYPIAVIAENQYLGYFILGYVLYNKSENIKLKKISLFALFIFSSAITCLLTYAFSLKNGQYEDVWFQYRNPFLMVSAACVFVIMLDLKYKVPYFLKQFINHTCRNSFGIYVFHIIFLNILNKIFDIYQISAFIGVPIFAIIIFILTDISVNLFLKIKYINILFT